MREGFAELRETLLRHGVSPGRVRRYCRELGEHLADLVEELEAAGHPPGEAARRARLRLGSTEALALPMLTDRRWRSLANRMPALAYVALPLGLLMLVAAAVAALLVALAPLALAGRAAWLAGLPVLAPVAIGWLLLGAALARRAGPFWPGLGLVASVAFGAMLDLRLALPEGGSGGGVAVALSGPDVRLLVLYLLGTLLPVPFMICRSRMS